MQSIAALAFISIAAVAQAQQGVDSANHAVRMDTAVSLSNETDIDVSSQPPSGFALMPTRAFRSSALAVAGRRCNRQCAVLHGAAIGLGVGVIGGALYGAHEDRTDNFGPSAVGIDAAAFGVIGGFVGAIWPLSPATPIVTAITPAIALCTAHGVEWRTGVHVKF